jgi:hypothetical protein
MPVAGPRAGPATRQPGRYPAVREGHQRPPPRAQADLEVNRIQRRYGIIASGLEEARPIGVLHVRGPTSATEQAPSSLHAVIGMWPRR